MGFLEWMRVAIPVVVVFTPLAWWWLTRGLRGRAELRLPELGAWRAEEVRVLVVFTLTAIAWVTRGQPDSGWGWSTVTLFTGATDATVAVAAALSLFLIGNGRGGRLMDWETAAKLPWGILLLFAGGIAIAKAFDASGLSKLIGDQLAGLGGWPLPAMLAVICVSVVFASELASNTAIATLLMPLLAAAAVGMGMEPRTLMIPAALAASLGFMLPVATPPNAIAFASGQVPVRTMVRNGFVLDLIGAAIITGVCYLLLV